jgi:hypothetical protein
LTLNNCHGYLGAERETVRERGEKRIREDIALRALSPRFSWAGVGEEPIIFSPLKFTNEELASQSRVVYQESGTVYWPHAKKFDRNLC